MRPEVLNQIEIPSKPFLTVEEAAIYFNVGENKLRELTDKPRCEFVVFIGRKRLIKKEKFFNFINEASSL